MVIQGLRQFSREPEPGMTPSGGAREAASIMAPRGEFWDAICSPKNMERVDRRESDTVYGKVELSIDVNSCFRTESMGVVNEMISQIYMTSNSVIFRYILAVFKDIPNSFEIQ